MKPLLPLLIVVSWFAIASAADDEKKPVGTASRFKGAKAGDARELVNGISFRWCPAGTFTMGEDDGKVSVKLTSGFWLGETEVTQGQWQKLMGTTPWKGESYAQEGADYAASYISHDDAVSFCAKLTTLERTTRQLAKGWKYSLPTEAQWEYACRAGSQTNYSFGDSEEQLSEYAWWGLLGGEAGSKSEQYAHVVGLKKPNAWGLRDMHGNVFESCSDRFADKFTGGRDPVGPTSGLKRVFRGGSWSSGAAICRSAIRSGLSPDDRKFFVGFRLAAVPE